MSRVTGRRKVAMKRTIYTLLLVISIIYIISPVDVLPDYIPILGWGDDLGAVIIAVISFCGLSRLNKADY